MESFLLNSVDVDIYDFFNVNVTYTANSTNSTNSTANGTAPAIPAGGSSDSSGTTPGTGGSGGGRTWNGNTKDNSSIDIKPWKDQDVFIGNNLQMSFRKTIYNGNPFSWNPKKIWNMVFGVKTQEIELVVINNMRTIEAVDRRTHKGVLINLVVT